MNSRMQFNQVADRLQNVHGTQQSDDLIFESERVVYILFGIDEDNCTDITNETTQYNDCQTDNLDHA